MKSLKEWCDTDKIDYSKDSISTSKSVSKEAEKTADKILGSNQTNKTIPQLRDKFNTPKFTKP